MGERTPVRGIGSARKEAGPDRPEGGLKRQVGRGKPSRYTQNGDLVGGSLKIGGRVAGLGLAGGQVGPRLNQIPSQLLGTCKQKYYLKVYKKKSTES